MTTGLRRIVALDIETTGLDSSASRLLEVGAVVLAPDLTMNERFSSLVNPCAPLSPAVTRLTGIHDADTCAAPSEAEAFVALRAFVGDALLVAHNAGFDREHLAAAARRVARPALDNEWLDTLELATILFPELDSHSLPTMASCLGCERRAHRALADAETTAELLIHLCARARELAPDERGLLVAANWEPLNLLEGLAAGSESKTRVKGVERPPTTAQPEPLGVSANAWEAEFIAADGSAGRLATRLPGFRPRQGQHQLAAAVGEVFGSGGIGVFEAGTGSGKSLAYLLPAAFAGAATGRRVIVSTKTKVLQRQLAERELLVVAGALPSTWRWAVLMGRENYLCRHRLDDAIAAQEELLADRERSLALAFLSGRVRRGEVDLSALPYGPSLRLVALQALAHELRSTRATCLGRHCPQRRVCLWRLAKTKAEAAHLVCANHALLLTAPEALPGFETVVIDEAHLLPAEATEAFTRRVTSAVVGRLAAELTPRGSRSLIRQLRTATATSAEQAPALTEAADVCERVSARLVQEANAVGFALQDLDPDAALDVESDPRRRPEDGYDLNIWLTPGLREHGSWERFATAAGILGESLTSLATAAAEAGTVLPDDHPAQPTLRGLAEDAGQAAWLLDDIQDCASADRVLWGEVANRRIKVPPARRDTAGTEWSLASAPLSPAAELRARLWDKLRSAILTSATLTVAGSFEYFRKTTGLHADLDVTERVFPSPFDYQGQAAIVALDRASLPRESAGDLAARHGDLLQRLSSTASGRTLALFTNRRDMRRVAAFMDEYAVGDSVLVLAQGVHGSAAAVASEFRNNPATVLLGVDALWTGQDFPGDALVCLVIAKLPFPRQDALFQARRRACELNGERWFESFYLPEAVLKFRQGCGRLIRTETDYGVIVVLDPRLTTQPYGRAFLASLPEYRVVHASPDTLAPTVETLLCRLAAQTAASD